MALLASIRPAITANLITRHGHLFNGTIADILSELTGLGPAAPHVD